MDRFAWNESFTCNFEREGEHFVGKDVSSDSDNFSIIKCLNAHVAEVGECHQNVSEKNFIKRNSLQGKWND